MKSIVGIIAVLLFVSCNSSKGPKFIPKSDTVFVLYRSPEGLNYRRGTYTTSLGRSFEDSTSLVAKPSTDTSWTILIPNPKDTIKDLKGKPLYDSSTHQFRFHDQWYKLTPVENKSVKIQIVNI